MSKGAGKAGWPSRSLGDLSEMITKSTTPTSIGHAFVAEGINFVKVESISENGRFIESKLAKITQLCHHSLKRSQLRPGDILFSIAGALGRTALVTEELLPANTNQALAIIRLRNSDDVLPEFVFKALETGIVLDQIEESKGGVAQQNLSLTQVQAFTIPIPPLPEQQRIVAILDEAFDGIATAKANAEKNLQGARALFESHLRSVFRDRAKDFARLSSLLSVQPRNGWSPPSRRNSSTPKIATCLTCSRMSPTRCRRSPARRERRARESRSALKYNNAIADAVADLGRPEEIGHIFAGFQKYLYQPGA